MGITRRVNKTFFDIRKRFSRYGRVFVGFTRVETHVNCYFSREIVFKAWLYCKKTPLLIDRTTIIMKGGSKKNNYHSNGIIEDQEQTLTRAGFISVTKEKMEMKHKPFATQKILREAKVYHPRNILMTAYNLFLREE